MFERLQSKLRSSIRPWKYTKAKRADSTSQSFEFQDQNNQVLESTRISEKDDLPHHVPTQGIPTQGKNTAAGPLPSRTPDLLTPLPRGEHHLRGDHIRGSVPGTHGRDSHNMSCIHEEEEEGYDEGGFESDHLSVLEYSTRQEMSWYGERHTEKVTQAYKGQLKLAVYVNSGLLTVHVMQARHLVSRYSGNCNSFVKVGVIPDDYCRSRSKTMLVKETNHPIYDEKFSFELMPEDMAKRVYICVCSKDRKRQTAELLGCMSFGINNVRRKRKDVNGWFYLLAESVGKRKHLQVDSSRHDNSRLSQVNDPGSSPWEPQQQNQSIRVLLERGKGGYGFSLTGSCPTSVARVDPGGPAHIAGIRTGDYLMRINGENVSSATAEQSGRIIRHCTCKVMLEFLRPGSHCNPRSSLWQPDHDDLDSSDSDDDDSVTSDHVGSLAGGYWGEEEMFSPLPPRPVKEGAKRVRFQDFQ